MADKKLPEMKIHIIGIGGTGMSPIAIVLHELGTEVSGSDRQESIYTQHLQELGIHVDIPQCAENITEPDLVLYSSAVHDDNPELQEARRRGIPTEKRRDFLLTLLQNRKPIAIAGSHGKTTTTSMCAWIYSRLGLEPGFIIGSYAKDLEKNAAAGTSPWFIIEADEYDRMFMGIRPYIGALTRVEYDHPDCFPTPDLYFGAFSDFLTQTAPEGKILLNGDDANQTRYRNLPGKDISTYGLEEDNDFRAKDLKLNPGGCYDFTFTAGEKSIPVSLRIPGKHNVYNALLALSTCVLNGLDAETAAQCLSGFHGIGRRFELVEEWNDITLIDDYAHHPTEIQATLRAAREFFPNRRIRAVWQPHTYSRTRSLLQEFAVSFKDADELIVTDIFAAREQYVDFGIEDVLPRLQHSSVHHLKGNPEIAEYLAKTLLPGDVVVTLSAGDANRAAVMALELMRNARG